MRAVLYTEDMEPITVVKLSETAQHYLREHRCAVIPVYDPIPIEVYRYAVEPVTTNFRTVQIYAEDFYRRGKKHTVLFTYDEESALLLKSVFLPGQHRAVEAERKEAFAKGFLSAIYRLGQDDY